MKKLKNLYSSFIGYFLKGIFLVLPIYFTLGLCLSALATVDKFIHFSVPGFGILILIFGSSLLGYIASKYVANSVAAGISNFLSKIPVVNVIYKASSDIMGSIIGEKKKFKQPVLITVSALDGIYKLGFLTQEGLEDLGLNEMVSVYVLRPYSIFGDLIIVDKSKIKFLEVSSSKVTKFVISGGFSDSD